MVEIPGIAILGAGLSGCVAACYLRRRGFEVDLFESRPDFRSDVANAGRSINLVLTSRGFNAVNEIGLLKDVLAICTPVYGRTLHHADGTTNYQAYGPDPSFCNYSVGRGDLNVCLLNAAVAAGARVHFEHAVDHIDVEKSTFVTYTKGCSPFINPTLVKRNESLIDSKLVVHSEGQNRGISIKARSIIATDGAGSRSRAALHMKLGSSRTHTARVTSPTPNVDAPYTQRLDDVNFLSGSSASALAEVDSARDIAGNFEVVTNLGTKYVELLMPAGENGRYLLDGDSLHIWPRGNHFLMGLPNKGGSFTMTLYIPEIPSRTAPDVCLSRLNSNDSVLAFFEKYYPNVPALIPNLTQQFTTNPRGFLGSVQCFPWHYQDKLVLLGDAAHAITPFFGQGCNAAFESVFVMMQQLDKYAMKPRGRGRNRSPSASQANTVAFKRYGRALEPAFAYMSRHHKRNTDAICTMAVDNFFEMMDKTGSHHFLHQKLIETALTDLFPGQFVSRYVMITHSLVPLLVCMELGLIQQHILDTLYPSFDSSAPRYASVEDNKVVLDEQKARELVQKLYIPALLKYNVTSSDLEDITRNIIVGRAKL